MRNFAAFFCGAMLVAAGAGAQAPASQPQSPYGGNTVEDIIARVNDQIISKTDYDRALQELDADGRQHGASMQELSEQHKDLLRNLIDQQLWLSKGKDLGITGDTELVKRLDDIRKQYNMATIEDLEAAAKEQGVSFEDFKQNIRNQIVTQEVMRQEVGQKIQFTPGEATEYYNEHKQDYAQPESEKLSEILISTGDNADQAKIDAAKAKADDVEARLHSGGDFTQLARSFSDGPTAASGGDLGTFKRGALAKVLEDKTFALETGQWTDPIQTRQGWVILKVVQHTVGGAAPYKDVEPQVEEALYMSRMEPAIRGYLTTMREQAFINIKSGYADTGASPNETQPVFSAYTPPAPKKKGKVERTRYRENARGFRSAAGQTVAPAAPTAGQATASTATPTKADKKSKQVAAKGDTAEKPGKREKIRYGQAPRSTLPTASKGSETVDAGALPANETASANTNEPANPLEPEAQSGKTRFSSRAKTDQKKDKPQSIFKQANPALAPAPDAGEVADRATQSTPLGLNGDTSTDNKKKKKKTVTTSGDKTRMSQEKKDDTKQPAQFTPAAPVPGAPAPANAPKPAGDATQPQQ